MFLGTHAHFFHCPASFELLLCLDEVSGVGPEVGAVARDEGKTAAACETRNVFDSAICFRDVFALNERVKEEEEGRGKKEEGNNEREDGGKDGLKEKNGYIMSIAVRDQIAIYSKFVQKRDEFEKLFTFFSFHNF